VIKFHEQNLTELVDRLVAAVERGARATPVNVGSVQSALAANLSYATSITMKAHLGHSNGRNPGVLLSSLRARQLGQRCFPEHTIGSQSNLNLQKRLMI
jgi:hypothetical protein